MGIMLIVSSRIEEHAGKEHSTTKEATRVKGLYLSEGNEGEEASGYYVETIFPSLG